MSMREAFLAALSPICGECYREFDLDDEQQAHEFYYGHDCEGGQ